MSQAVLAKLWSLISVTAVYVSLNAWSVTQQWQLTWPGNVFRDDKFTPHGVTLVAIPIAGFLLVLSSLLARTYARRSNAGHWAGKVPRTGNVAINVATFEGRLFQGAGLGVLVIFPAAAQVHFAIKFLAGTVRRSDGTGWAGVDHLLRYVPLSDSFSGRYAYDATGTQAPSFAPFWQPWLFMLIEVAVFAAVAASLAAIFSAPASRWRGGRHPITSRSGG